MAGDHEEPGRALVEPVHDARSVRVRPAPVKHVSEPGGQAVDERAVAVSRPWVHDEAGRFVDHDDIVVRVDDDQLDRRVAGDADGGNWNLDLQLGAGDDPLAALGDDAAGEPHPTGFDHCRRLVPRQAGEEGHDAVDAFAVQGLGDLNPHRTMPSHLRRPGRRPRGLGGSRSRRRR